MPSLAEDPEAVKAMDSAVLMKRGRPESKWFKTKAAKMLAKKHRHIGLKIPHWVGQLGLTPLEVRVLSLIVHWFEGEGSAAQVVRTCNVSKKAERFMMTSYSAIADEVCCERRSVRRILAVLIDLGFIHLQSVPSKKGGANWLAIRPSLKFQNKIVEHADGRSTWVSLWLQVALGKQPHAQSWLLSQLIYFTSRSGGVYREKRRWVIQGPRMLSKSLGMPRMTVVDALKKLKEKGLLEYKLWPYKGQKTLHIRLRPNAIAELLEGSRKAYEKAAARLWGIPPSLADWSGVRHRPRAGATVHQLAHHRPPVGTPPSTTYTS